MRASKVVLTILVAVAALWGTGATAKEGSHLAAPVGVAVYNDGSTYFLTLDPEPTTNGFRCEVVRLYATTEARRRTMFEFVTAYAPHLPFISFYLEDATFGGNDVCRVTNVTRLGRTLIDGLIGEAPDELLLR